MDAWIKIRLIVISIALAIADQITKRMADRWMGLSSSVPLIKGILHFTRVENTGSLFGLFKGSNLPLIILSFVVGGAIIFLIASDRLPKDWVTRTAAVLLLAGTIGNLIDRLRTGAVFDFIDFQIWPVFNLADILITTGVSALLVKEFKTPQDPQDP